MAAGGGGFFAGLYNSPFGDKLKANRERANKEKEAQLDIYHKALANPDLAILPDDPDEVRQHKQAQLDYLQQQVGKLSGTDAKPLLQRAFDIGRQVLRHGPQGAAPAKPAAAPGVPPPPAAASAAPPQDLGNGITDAEPPAKPAVAPPPSPKYQPSMADAYRLANPTLADKAKSLQRQFPDLDEHTAMAWAMGKTPIKPVKVSSGVNPADGKMHTTMYNPTSGEYNDVVSETPQMSGMYMRPMRGNPISVTDAIAEQQRTGQPPMGTDGPIDLSKLRPGMGLLPIKTGNTVTYVPFSPNDKVVTVGNERFAISPMDVQQLGSGAGADLGQATTAKTTEKKAYEFGTTSTSAPTTSGVKGRGAKGGAGAPAPARPMVPPPPGAPAASAAPTNDGMPPASPTLGQAIRTPAANTQIMQAIPVREAARTVFGDPSDPSFKSLRDFAPLVDRPDTRKRIGTAITMTLAQADNAIQHEGGIMTLIKTEGGLPQALATAFSGARSEVIQNLKPEERELYDTLMTAYSNVIGLRSLTKASAAQFSVRQLENELPIPGVNTVSSKQFYDQLAKLGKQIENGANIQKVGLSKAERDQISQGVREFSALAQGKSVAPPPGGGKSAPKWNAVKGVYE